METITEQDIMHQIRYKGHELGMKQIAERNVVSVQFALLLQSQIADIENDITELKRELSALGAE